MLLYINDVQQQVTGKEIKEVYFQSLKAYFCVDTEESDGIRYGQRR